MAYDWEVNLSEPEPESVSKPPPGLQPVDVKGIRISKDLVAASSVPLVLAILLEGDSYGYAILKRVRDLSGGRLEWTDGMLYPVLHRLERLGQIEAEWRSAPTGRRRKYYRITARGRAQIAEERSQWEAVDAALRSLWQNLELSLKETVMEGELGKA